MWEGDGDPALVQVQEAAKAARQDETILQNPPEYDPQSKGVPERAVQKVKRQWGLIKLGLEARIGEALTANVAIMDGWRRTPVES